MAVTDDDEEDLWAGLEDNDSKISVSSNLLEVRRARRSHLPLHPPPNAWLLQLIAAHNSLAHLQLLGR